MCIRKRLYCYVTTLHMQSFVILPQNSLTWFCAWFCMVNNFSALVKNCMFITVTFCLFLLHIYILGRDCIHWNMHYLPLYQHHSALKILGSPNFGSCIKGIMLPNGFCEWCHKLSQDTIFLRFLKQDSISKNSTILHSVILSLLLHFSSGHQTSTLRVVGGSFFFCHILQSD